MVKSDAVAEANGVAGTDGMAGRSPLSMADRGIAAAGGTATGRRETAMDDTMRQTAVRRDATRHGMAQRSMASCDTSVEAAPAGFASAETILRGLRRADYPVLADLLLRTWHGDDAAANRRRIAAADLESCLARTTHAAVAQIDGVVAGVILGGVRGAGGRATLPNRHLLRAAGLLLPLTATRDGRRDLARLLRAERTNRALSAAAARRGRRYDAEVVLLILEPWARGLGLGGRLFDWMMARFRRAGVRAYFLYTDGGCDVGFYDHRGLTRRAEIDGQLLYDGSPVARPRRML